jgi:conjugative relaxase-like TrwC/TraI family protein
MGLHKLTAGDGYLYLIRQVAAADATERGRPSLADYYTDKGESPGRWLGSGLPSLGNPPGRDRTDPTVAELWSVTDGSEVTEDQMKALFGEGLHPNAERITRHLSGLGLGRAGATAAARLGRPFRISNAENDFTRRLRSAYLSHNLSIGAHRDAPIDDDVRARLRSAVATEMFTEQYSRPPADDREFTGFLARQTRAPTTAVAGYDLTFTPVKSVSALWALAPRALAETIEDCHHRAVTDALTFLEEHAAFSRTGSDGIAQVDTTGLIAAVFDHRDSRAGDPNLHTHVAVSNKVHAVGADGIGRWLALDGTPLYRAAVAASELYNTRLEAHLITAVGVRFTDTSTGEGRPIREIDGIPPQLLQRWSSRRTAIEHRVGQLAKAFQSEHHREPTVVEMLALSQQATLETREGKHEPRSLAEQRHTWRTEAVEILGSRTALTDLTAGVTGHPLTRPQTSITPPWVDEQAAAIITTLAETRSTWQVNHVRAEAQRRLRYTAHHHDPGVVGQLVRAALTAHSIVVSAHTDTAMNEPPALRRRDGTSIYTRHDTTVYTSTAVLAAERRILAAAERVGGRVVDETSIDIGVKQQRAERDTTLNDGQIAMVTGLATSGRRVQLALAPAGTGKTTAMAALAAAWINAGGAVLGLAPTAAAAEVLGADLGAPTDTIAKLAHLAATTPTHATPVDDPARKWFDAIGSDTLIVVDEAGMASTADLDAVIGHAMATGAYVRLIGDDHQLASVSAGGVLRDIAERTPTPTLTAVVRFGDTDRGRAEGAASLALRHGDPAGIAFYLDHHRVYVGADEAAADQAYHAWSTDRDDGRDALLLAPTNDLVATLNQRARLDRLRTAARASAEVRLADDLLASAGDIITTRSNARWLRSTDGTWVRNGNRWRIIDVTPDGSVLATALRAPDTAGPVRLPPDYVAHHTTLGYAATINAAQGVTADTCHVVGSDRLTRRQLYVALTRGRAENHVYFSTAEADPHRILSPKATHPPTAVDILSAILRRDGAQLSAHTAQAVDTDPFTRLHPAAGMYADALSRAAEHRAGPAVMAAIDTAATQIDPAITEGTAWPVLRRNLALLAVDGHDPIAALRHAAATPFDDAHDPAAVLDWRLPVPVASAAARVGPLRWLPALPDAVTADPRWGSYLADRAALVTELAAQIRDTARGWTAATAPGWARPLLGRQPELLAEIAVFRAAHDVDPADSRITGPPQYANRSAAVQRLINGRVDAGIRRSAERGQRWHTMLETIGPQLREDPFFPQLATHLDDAARAGADISRLLRTALTDRGPLPDELPAAALWWRLAGSLEPAALQSSGIKLRPPWIGDLHRILGSATAETVIADPAWPALVVAVAASDWAPGDLLSAAAEYLYEASEVMDLRPDEYARLLTYRVELLTRGVDGDAPAPHPAEVADSVDALDEHEPPPDPLDYLTDDAESNFHGLDFADLSPHRPATSALTDTDITALRERRDISRAHAHTLARSIFRGQGPAESAAADELAALHHRHRQQRPFQFELAQAHADWVAAETTHDRHSELLSQLDEEIADATHRQDGDLADRYRRHRLQLQQHTAAIAAAVVRTRQQRDAAHEALMTVTGGPNGIVSERDIQLRRAAALAEDTAILTVARAEARDLENRLGRAESAAVRAFARRTMDRADLAVEATTCHAAAEKLVSSRHTKDAGRQVGNEVGL